MESDASGEATCQQLRSKMVRLEIDFSKVARPGGLELPTFWFVGLGAKNLSDDAALKFAPSNRQMGYA
jgi:hypothetical protein